MNIRVGRFTILSDKWCYWITEEFQTKGKNGNPGKMNTKRVAGYTNQLDNLLRQFASHEYLESDAKTVEELIKELKKTFKDMVQINEALVSKDIKALGKTAKRIKEINEENGEQQ